MICGKTTCVIPVREDFRVHARGSGVGLRPPGRGDDRDLLAIPEGGPEVRSSAPTIKADGFTNHDSCNQRMVCDLDQRGGHKVVSGRHPTFIPRAGDIACAVGRSAAPYGGLVIIVVEYDRAWPERFAALRDEYATAMAAAGVPVAAIEHVGSTSVPGLAAKPIIDCDIVVADADVAAAATVLVTLGFAPEGELGIPQRWAFKEPARLSGTNTYVVVADCLSLRNHLAVRDVLRADAALRAEYAAVKREAGARAATIDDYGQAKSAIVQKILAAAGLTAAERASIAANQVPSHDDLPR